MPRRKKPFIDKKNSVTFHLVHRSQKDPLAADDTAPQHVLLEAQPLNKRKEEQQKFGIYFDDDYDYLQHLKVPEKEDLVWESVENPNHSRGQPENVIQLPSSVFASEFEEDVGLLNKAAPVSGPRPDWDPDIVAALDDDFDYENSDNELEDNFMEMANGSGDGMDDIEEDDEEDEEEWSDYSDEKMDLVENLRANKRFDMEETKSRFTEYSMSSSVIRRNEQLTLLDDRFEKFYEMYDEPEVGALDCEEIEGDMEMSNQMILQLAEEFKKKKEADCERYEKKWDKERIKKLNTENASDEELIELEVEDEGKKEKKWDCESILSNYSNIYNHPKVIEEKSKQRSKIELNLKTGIPKNVLHGDNGTLTASTLAKLSNGASNEPGKSLCAESVLSTLSVLSIRPSDETPEERKERKKLLKEYRAERRLEKKANKLAFRDEGKKQVQIKINENNNRGTAIV